MFICYICYLYLYVRICVYVIYGIYNSLLRICEYVMYVIFIYMYVYVYMLYMLSISICTYMFICYI